MIEKDRFIQNKENFAIFSVVSLLLMTLLSGWIVFDKMESPAVDSGLTQKQRTINQMMEGMTIEDKIGQLFLGHIPEQEAEQIVGAYYLGGYMLESKDVEGKSLSQLKKDLASYQKASNIPLLLASNEEGGAVSQISPILKEPFASPMEMYDEGGLDAVLEGAKSKVSVLKDLGISAGFFPIADVVTNPSSPIYERTLGQDAMTTSDYVREVVTLLKEENFLSTLKHFPGSSETGDVITGLVYDDRPVDELRKQDFLPFEAGIEAGADSVMVSHIILTAVSDQPSSISPEVMAILRQELGFEGVILTDDFDKLGLSEFLDQNEAALQAIEAGADMILSSNFTSQIPYLLDQVKRGKLSEDRIEQSVERILGMKYDLGLVK